MSHKSTLYDWPLRIILLVGFVLVALRVGFPRALSAVYIERVQLVAFPLLLVALWFARVGGIKLPRVILAVAGIVGAAVTAYGYVYLPKSARASFIFSRLQDDKDESASRLFRERVQVLLQKTSEDPGRGGLQRYFKSFSSDSDARSLFRDDAPLQAVVWGDSQMVRISMRDRTPVSAVQFSPIVMSSVGRALEIVDSVPVMAIPSEPRDVTAFFVTRVFQALSEPPEPLSPDFNVRYGDGAILLRLAADEATQFPSRAHRAFALWRAGTNSLLMYLNSGAIEQGYLRCARAELERAQAMLIPRENPDLSGAILNNLGVVAVLRAETEGVEEGLAMAHRYFADASKTGQMRTVNGENPSAYGVARRNVARLAHQPTPEESATCSRKPLPKRKSEHRSPLPMTHEVVPVG